MPIFEYRCEKCKKTFETLVFGNQEVSCPTCKGKKVKNPQTGVMITLPGKSVGTVKVIMTGGDTPETEYSFVEVTSNETIDSTNMSNYIIEQAK